MIKYMEEKDLEVCLGEEVSLSDVVLYEHGVESDLESEMIFMINDESGPIATPISKLDNITLWDLVGREATFNPENIENKETSNKKY